MCDTLPEETRSIKKMSDMSVRVPPDTSHASMLVLSLRRSDRWLPMYRMRVLVTIRFTGTGTLSSREQRAEGNRQRKKKKTRVDKRTNHEDAGLLVLFVSIDGHQQQYSKYSSSG